MSKGQIGIWKEYVAQEGETWTVHPGFFFAPLCNFSIKKDGKKIVKVRKNWGPLAEWKHIRNISDKSGNKLCELKVSHIVHHHEIAIENGDTIKITKHHKPGPSKKEYNVNFQNKLDGVKELHCIIEKEHAVGMGTVDVKDKSNGETLAVITHHPVLSTMHWTVKPERGVDGLLMSEIAASLMWDTQRPENRSGGNDDGQGGGLNLLNPCSCCCSS